MRKIIQLKLRLLAKLVLKKYQPIVVGVTGSVGKTSTKEAIDRVLSSKMNVRSNQKNYNNEIGLPLTIIGQTTAGRSLGGWLKVFYRAFILLIKRDKNYPEVLILEMGIDRPGDMDYLLSIVAVKVAVVTAVTHSHLEYFTDIANIKKEKQKIVEKLGTQGLAILNYDNKLTLEMEKVSRSRVMTFGLNDGANIQAQDIVFNFSKGSYELMGVHFKLNSNGSVVPVTLDNIIAATGIYAALAAVAVGVYFKMNIIEITRALKGYTLPKGRMNLLPGVKHTFLIDDSYNSAPESALIALQTLREIRVESQANKYAVLGDMLEIGRYTEEGHRLVGKRVAESKIDYLITIGKKARDIVHGAIKAGLDKDHIFHFDQVASAGKFLENRMKAGDVILIKGSQKMRMEKIVEEVMAEPNRAKELLVRQGKEWQ